MIGNSSKSTMIDAPCGVTVCGWLRQHLFQRRVPLQCPQIPGSGSSAGGIYLYAGENANPSVKGTTLKRADAGTFGIGNPHGVAADSNNNVYIADATNGVVWRVDGAGDIPGQMTQPMYVVAGGATTVCGASIVPGAGTVDANGDRCAATSAKFSTGTTAGIFGLSGDAYSDVFVGDSTNNLVREIASGTQFGSIGANQPTQYVEIHFAANDSPASASPYQLTAGGANFSLGTASCTNCSNTTAYNTSPR